MIIRATSASGPTARFTFQAVPSAESPQQTPSHSCPSCSSITSGNDQALYCIVNGAAGQSVPATMSRITLTGSVTTYPLPYNSGNVYSITRGPDGALWAVDSSSNNILRTGKGVNFASASELYMFVASFPSQVSPAPTAAGVTSSSAILSWTAASGKQSAVHARPHRPFLLGNGAVVTGYTISARIGNGSFVTLISNTGSAAVHATVTGLFPATTYQLSVAAVTSMGTGAASASVLVTTEGNFVS